MVQELVCDYAAVVGRGSNGARVGGRAHIAGSDTMAADVVVSGSM